MVPVMVLLAGLCLPSQEPQADPKHIDQLIQDLGGTVQQRDKARAELRKIGKPAIPALKNATRDADAERAMAARALLLDLMGQEPQSGKGSDVRVVYHDWANGIDFVRDADGHITLTVPEHDREGGKRRFKTYRADSLEEFQKQYPEIAKKYDVEKLASPERVTEQVRKDWEAMKKQLGIDGQDSADLESPTEKQEQDLQKHSADGADGTSPKHALGILVAPAGPALRAQLGLPGQGALVVHGVQPGSLAEKSGLKPYDVLTQLNGKPIEDAKTFRADLEKAMSMDRFSLGIVRGGKAQTIEVTPPAGK